MPRVVVQDGMRSESNIYHGCDGHSYHRNKVKKTSVYLRCYLYYKNRCRGAAILDMNTGVLTSTRVHNHRRPQFLIHERRLRHAVLNRCRTTDSNNFKEIYNEERRRLRTPHEAAANVSFVKLRPSMQLARQDLFPNIPHSLSELGVTLRDPANVHLTQTLDGLDNIFAGVTGQSNDGTRCILLFSKRMLQYMRNVKQVFSDATFVVPRDLGCYQIWNLVTLRRHHIIRLGRVLMQTKRTDCYITALQALRQLSPEFRPREVMCDFELMEQNAWAEVYPHSECHGCHFHHVKDVCGKAKELGLTLLLRADDHADSIVRSLCAIPFLKHEQIIEGYYTVLERATNRDLQELAPLMDYYLRTWILNQTRYRVLSVRGCENRTSNCSECDNRDLRREARVKHPNAYQLLGAVVNLEDENQVDLQVLRKGLNPSKKRRASSLMNDVTIAGLTEDLDRGHINVATFLRRASRRIQGAYDQYIHGAGEAIV